MKKYQIKISFILSCMILSSCGLVEKFKTPETNTESSQSTNQSTASDDLFNTVENSSVASSTASDMPQGGNSSELFNEEKPIEVKSDFNSSAPNETQIAEVKNDPIFGEEAVATTAPTKEEVLEIKPEAAIVEKVKPAEPIIVREEKIEPVIEKEDVQLSLMNPDSIKTYKVKSGETLMQIAFKLYGDIDKWKALKELNGNKISRNSALASGMELKYHPPVEPFLYAPVGNPYLIKSGDTLGIISNQVYNSPSKWKSIWQNNRQLIKNPNRIYAGFTLYYKSLGMIQASREKVEEVLSPLETIELGESFEEVSEKLSAPSRN